MTRYRRLLVYALRYWYGWAAIVVVTLLSTALGLLQPWPIKILVDHVLGQEPIAESPARIISFLPGADTAEGLLAWVAIAGLAIFALDSVVDTVLTVSWIRAGQQMVYDLANDLFAHLQRQSLLFHSRNSVGDSMARVTGDSWCVHTVVDTLLFAPGHAIITLTGLVAVMVQMNPTLTFLSLVVAPLMVGASVVFGRPIRALALIGRQIESHIHSHVHQTLSGLPVVHAFGQEERQHSRFQEFAKAAIRAQRRGTLIGNLSGLSSGLIGSLGMGAIVLVGAGQVLEGQLTIGSLLVFVAYLNSLQAQMTTFTRIYGTMQEAAASIDRVEDILETEQEVKDRLGAVALPPVQGHIRLEQVSFGYEPDRPVLHDVSLEALPGETVAIVGSTGAGKSTLVSLVPRFFDPWSGRVSVDGHDVRDVQVKSLRAQIALVLQEPFLFPITIGENIAYGRPDASRDAIEEVARAANAHRFIMNLPEGYDTLVGERGATLSGGERQRLAIARALLKDAPILILDEPTSALDAETEGQLLEALERLMAGRTTLIIAHRLSTIRGADRIAVLDEGRIIEEGTHDDLIARSGRYARFYHLQFGAQREPVPVGSGERA